MVGGWRVKIFREDSERGNGKRLEGRFKVGIDWVEF